MNPSGHRMLHTGRLRSACYDEAARVLEIAFHDGTTKRYRGVPMEVARRFFASPNPASFWEDRIAEEYPASSGRVGGAGHAASTLDDLFRKPD